MHSTVLASTHARTLLLSSSHFRRASAASASVTDLANANRSAMGALKESPCVETHAPCTRQVSCADAKRNTSRQGARPAALAMEIVATSPKQPLSASTAFRNTNLAS